MSRRSLFWLVFAAALALDQATKLWARTSFVEHQSPGFPWPGVFEFTLTYNEGIAFGLFQGLGLLLAPVAVAIAFGAWLYSTYNPKEGAWTHAAMALLCGGALGNLFDRIVFKKVTDMFWFRAIDFPVFNIADSCITISAAILIVKWSRELVPEEKKPAVEGAPADLPKTVSPKAETAPSEIP
jgi:signal peptidase II